MPLRAVIFDLGHTVWDFAPREDVRRLNVLRLHERLTADGNGSVPAPADLDRALVRAIARWMRDWDSDVLEQPPSEQLVTEALDDAGLKLPDDLIEELTALLFGREVDMPVVEPDSIATIARLAARGLVMGCVSNTILLENGINDALMRLGLLRYFRSVVASSSMGYRKPHASLFQRALRELELEPQDAVFVGDRLIDDVGGAQDVGMSAVLTYQYRQEPVEGATVIPDAVIRRLAELPAAIDAIEQRTSDSPVNPI